jgi:DNA-binding MarR family transcriptional regulator
MLQELTELSLPQFLALRSLIGSPKPPTPSYVARRLGCSKPNAAHLIALLEEKECVRRRRDPRDARSYSVQLTVRGVGHIASCEEQLDDDAARIFDPLDTHERLHLHWLLQKLTFPPR